jgi:hypothetical protein
MYTQTFIKRHYLFFSISIFLIFYCIVFTAKPSFLYRQDGVLREFGLGFKNKTIIPLWLVAILLAICSYLFILFYLTVCTKSHKLEYI